MAKTRAPLWLRRLIKGRCLAQASNVIPAYRCERELGHDGAHRNGRVWWLH